MYKTMIRPKIEYAISSFANMTKKSLNIIKVMTNDFLRRGLGLLRSTPNHVLLHMSAELPMELRATLCTAKEIIKSNIHSLPISEYIESIDGVNTSMAKVYSQYQFVFNDLGILEDSISL